MARNIYPILLIGAVFFLCLSALASAQGRRYSLSPIAPFPCGAVNVEGNSIAFRETIVFVCNGK